MGKNAQLARSMRALGGPVSYENKLRPFSSSFLVFVVSLFCFVPFFLFFVYKYFPPFLFIYPFIYPLFCLEGGDTSQF